MYSASQKPYLESLVFNSEIGILRMHIASIITHNQILGLRISLISRTSSELVGPEMVATNCNQNEGYDVSMETLAHRLSASFAPML